MHAKRTACAAVRHRKRTAEFGENFAVISAKRFLSAVRARKLLGKFREPRTRLGIDQRIHDGRIELGDHVRGRPNRARWIE
jgi:hypothetical protein